MCIKVAKFKNHATEDEMWDNELLALLRTTGANLQNVVKLKTSVPNFLDHRAMALTFSEG